MRSRRRLRHHVNPLAVRYIEPRAREVEVRSLGGPPGAFQRVPERVEVELGCADAKFSFELAARNPNWAVIGLDIRERVIEQNQEFARDAGLTNLLFAYVNVNVDLDRVFSPGTVDRFHVLFPDPWFKARHHKRRVITPEFLDTLVLQLRPGGEVHAATDVFEIGLELLAGFEADERFCNLTAPWSFSHDAPVGARSRREDMTRARGQRVWRMRYRTRASEA